MESQGSPTNPSLTGHQLSGCEGTAAVVQAVLRRCFVHSLPHYLQQAQSEHWAPRGGPIPVAGHKHARGLGPVSKSGLEPLPPVDKSRLTQAND
jgi:hypothetical protein